MTGLAPLLALFGLVPLPGTSSVSTPMQPPEDCRRCHGNFAGSAFDTWAGSSMGHAARDPLFFAALDEAEKDFPGAGDFCLRCHAPEAWVQGRCFPSNGGRLSPEDSGVTCSTCHRMDPSDWQRNGQFRLGEDLDYRGPYADAQAPHGWQQSDFISESRLCGTCHDLRNPLVRRKNLDGTDTGQPFPEQTTYTEWATSAFANGPDPQSCADCHMPKSMGEVAAMGPIRSDRSDHGITGANVFLKSAIAFLYPELGLSQQLGEGESKARAILRTAATLEVSSPPAEVRRGEVVPLTVRVTNLTGHKLPTGYPEGRRMWLEVRSAGLGVDRGAFDPGSGEPDAPVEMWRSVQGQHGIGPGHRLVLNDTIFSDNRIPPRGFVPTATTAPVGKVFEEVSEGVLAHWDDVVVTGTVSCDESEMFAEVEVVLWYQSVTKRYADALVADAAGSLRGQLLQIAFEEVDPGPLEVARETITIPLDPDSSCQPPDAGVVDSGARDTGPPDSGARADAGLTRADAGTVPQPEGGCRCVRPEAGPDGLLGLALLCLWGLGRRRDRGP